MDYMQGIMNTGKEINVVLNNMETSIKNISTIISERPNLIDTRKTNIEYMNKNVINYFLIINIFLFIVTILSIFTNMYYIEKLEELEIKTNAIINIVQHQQQQKTP